MQASTRRTITTSLRRAMREDYAAGFNRTQIARRYGVRWNTVERYTRDIPCPRKARIAKAVAAYAAGESSVKVGRKYGLAPTSVLMHARRAGVEIRPVGTRT